ncbi:hydroxyacylglutathione hydrolase-like protein isoform X6 [Globicephala melas]|uniref:hydroxyacylglutathione hydrolase-like protein isoform X6 n=1 Tax=Globicephala melas TaxID=9731 RepID=UPI003873776C
MSVWTRPPCSRVLAALHLPTPPPSAPSTFSDPPNSPGDALSVAGCGSRLETTAQQMYHSLVETLGTLPPETVSRLPLTLSWGPASLHNRCTLHLPYARVQDDCLPAVGTGGPGGGEGLGHWGECLCPSLPMVVLCTPSAFFLQKVFCGHEHTLGNLEFAQKVEPCNNHVKAKLSWAKKRDEDDVPTVPSTLGEELLYNPFLRVALPSGSHRTPSPCREEPVRKFTGKVAPAEVLEVLCRERASFERAAEPLQPQAQALLALQWGLLSMPRPK